LALRNSALRARRPNTTRPASSIIVERSVMGLAAALTSRSARSNGADSNFRIKVREAVALDEFIQAAGEFGGFEAEPFECLFDLFETDSNFFNRLAKDLALLIKLHDYGFSELLASRWAALSPSSSLTQRRRSIPQRVGGRHERHHGFSSDR